MYLGSFSSTICEVFFVRQCPDALSNLMFVPFEQGTSLWARITSWLRFGRKEDDEVKALNVVDDPWRSF